MLILPLFMFACLSGFGISKQQFMSQCGGEFRCLLLAEFNNFTVHESTCVVNGDHIATINDQNTSNFISDFIRGVKAATAMRIAYFVLV